jgi:hypothetical protein
MSSCPRCGCTTEVKTEYCTRCGLRVAPSTDDQSSEEEYVPGIVAAARKKMEAAAAPSTPSPELSGTYPLVDRRKRPRTDIGKRESKVYDTRQGDKFYYDYMDPNYVPSLLATAPPPPPPLENAGVRSNFVAPSAPGSDTVKKPDEQVPIWMRPKKPL